MKTKEAVFIGIDIGTQGVRVMALSENGQVLSTQTRVFTLESAREEQDPRLWWKTVITCLQRLTSHLHQSIALDQIQAVSVTSTSGTVIAMDNAYEPVSPAIMYSDRRSFDEAEWCKTVAKNSEGAGFTDFNSSSGLPKIVWFVKTEPQQSGKIALWVHAADYVLGKMSGVWGITDYTNALKTGYDLVNEKWPDYIHDSLDLPSAWFPKVVPSGTVLGNISPGVSSLTGLPRSVKVVSGMTDGCASQIASGAIDPGEWNTTIGTTLVVKGVTYQPVTDPLGRLYNHRHPNGYWMPGGASNTGADWVAADYGEWDLQELNDMAKRLIPTQLIAYPLKQKGERFPFLSGKARGFDPAGATAEERFVARMEGVAYLERLSYEMIENLSGEAIDAVYVAGGTSKSDVWLNIRSHVLQKTVIKMTHTEGAVGAAIVASVPYFGNVQTAGKRLNQEDKVFHPEDGHFVEQYEANYRRFVDTLVQKGYINASR